MRKIAVMTTGGDAPGMNAAIRAVVRGAIASGMEAAGVMKGYAGLLENRIVPMSASSVGGIINRGGTILQTVRCPEFKLRERREEAYRVLRANNISGLAVIGGDGSRKGAWAVARESKIPTVFIPGSIDNDVYGTDQTIGFDTAVNTGLEAIDKIRDTAASHERIFIIEIMGREHGFLALEVGLTGGAEIILLPEYRKEISIKKITKKLKAGMDRGKNSSIIAMAEGVGLSRDFASLIEKETGVETRYSVLGYVQRGGTPTAMSRKLGLAFGYEAAAALKRAKPGESRMVGIRGGQIEVVPMSLVVGKERKIDARAYDMNEVFSI